MYTFKICKGVHVHVHGIINNRQSEIHLNVYYCVMTHFIGKSHYNISKVTEALIDTLCLFQSLRTITTTTTS